MARRNFMLKARAAEERRMVREAKQKRHVCQVKAMKLIENRRREGSARQIQVLPLLIFERFHSPRHFSGIHASSIRGSDILLTVHCSTPRDSTVLTGALIKLPTYADFSTLQVRPSIYTSDYGAPT